MSTNKEVNADAFAKEVVELMKQYTTEVEEAISQKTIEIGYKGLGDIQSVVLPQATSVGTATPSERKAWDNYSSSWALKIDNKRNYTSSTLHNKKHYGLTHLLEYGHATRDGKRTRAFAHIDPLEEKLSKELLDSVQEIIKKGGN